MFPLWAVHACMHSLHVSQATGYKPVNGLRGDPLHKINELGGGNSTPLHVEFFASASERNLYWLNNTLCSNISVTSLGCGEVSIKVDIHLTFNT